MKYIGNCFKERVIILEQIAVSGFFMISFETLALCDLEVINTSNRREC